MNRYIAFNFNKMHLFRFLFFYLFLLLAGQIIAQPQQENQSLESAKEKVNDLFTCVDIITNETASNEKKKIAILTALDLFIGKGMSYRYLDDEGEFKLHSPVEILRVDFNGRKRVFSVKQYLNGLLLRKNHQKEIESIDIFRIDSIYLSRDGEYEADCQYMRGLFTYRDGAIMCKDGMRKKMKIRESTPSSSWLKSLKGKNYPIVLLGNIYYYDI